MKASRSRVEARGLDELVEYLSKTDYDPNGMTRFFEKIAALSGSKPGTVQHFLSDPPDTGDRIRSTQKLIAKLPPEKQKGNTYKERFTAYKTMVVPRGAPAAAPQNPPPAAAPRR